MSEDIVFSGHQPNFLPYMGVIYKMFKSDIFVLDDDVQYSSKGLHNANYIKVNGNKYKMVVPVSYNFGDKINQVKISYATDWDVKLLKTIENNYRKAPFFDEVYPEISLYLTRTDYLIDMNAILFVLLKRKFNLKCELVVASAECPTDLTNNERNVYQCKKFGASIYLSGTGGKAYNDEEMYRREGIKVVYSDYVPTVYRQQGKGFIENLSVLDYIFNNGYELPAEWYK